MKKTVRRIFKGLGILLGIVLLAVIGLFVFLTIREYYPRETVSVGVEQLSGAAHAPAPGDSLTLLDWNIGYCGLDRDEDFFMDGGTMSITSSAELLPKTLNGIAETIKKQQADVVFLQEIDRDSARSYHVNEYELLSGQVGMANRAFANNYLCDYVPYPIPGMLGKVDSGLAILSDLAAESADRVPLPCPFSWPVRIANLKRCLLVERIPLEGTDKQLVLIDLHLEAYDSGEGKLAQTQQLMQLLQEEYAAGNYVIAGGDFNQTFPDAPDDLYAIREEGLWTPGVLDTWLLDDGWTLAYDGSTPTCRSLDKPYTGDPMHQYYLIDGLLLSPNVRLDSIETLDEGFTYSDHNPLRLEFTLCE